ncbi:MAG: DUF1178 family protein [Erythrobacter sp.]
MIVYDLHCSEGHRFEGWFGSSLDFEEQCERSIVLCPQCGSSEVGKAPMAPAVSAKGNRAVARRAKPNTQVASETMSAEMKTALTALAKAQAKVLENSTWVGADFAETSRAMHYGEKDEAPIHGEASLDDARALAEEGIRVAPLPLPVAPPKKLN